MKLHRVAWVAGMVGLLLSHYWLVVRIEPFYSSIYCFLWWSYIFAVDFAVCRLRGHSLLRDQPRELLFLAVWSVPVWLVFEMANLRLHDWYYVMSPYRFSWGTFYLVLAFATVLPGIFETMSLVLGLIEKFVPGGSIAGRPFVVSRLNIALQLALGASMLALALAFPKNCFCLVWGFAYFLTDPICYRVWRARKNHAGRSLLGQLAAGDNTRLVALLVAGFICGGLWEAWNLGARTKWIYSVPFFDEVKLGEMPLLGFLGFPPFALECYALVNFLALFRNGRNWELSRQDNTARRGMPAWGVVLCAVLLPLGILSASAAIVIGGTIASYSTPLDRYFARELGEQGVNALRDRRALQGNQFLKLKERPPAIDPALFARMRRIATMAELKGMGFQNALALEALGIKSAADLALRNPNELILQIKPLNQDVRLEQVKIWIREANRIRG
ncbi:MAG TPA: DUF4332 domain-containing protein [Candidatus Baltobacteraceae bacterium]|jgi:hypothetical protein|nr:DUF4332 domain-containing protein [Candidatus Baltobacteraceae bacterium]